MQDDPLFLHQAHPLLLHLVGLVGQPEPGLHVLGNHRDVVVAHIRHPNDLEVLVLQDDLVVVLDLAQVKAGGGQVGFIPDLKNKSEPKNKGSDKY